MAPPRKSAEGVSTPSKKPATTETGESSNSAASKKDGGSKEGGKDSTSQGLNVEVGGHVGKSNVHDSEVFCDASPEVNVSGDFSFDVKHDSSSGLPVRSYHGFGAPSKGSRIPLSTKDDDATDDPMLDFNEHNGSGTLDLNDPFAGALKEIRENESCYIPLNKHEGEPETSSSNPSGKNLIGPFLSSNPSFRDGATMAGQMNQGPKGLYPASKHVTLPPETLRHLFGKDAVKAGVPESEFFHFNGTYEGGPKFPSVFAKGKMSDPIRPHEMNVRVALEPPVGPPGSIVHHSELGKLGGGMAVNSLAPKRAKIDKGLGEKLALLHDEMELDPPSQQTINDDDHEKENLPGAGWLQSPFNTPPQMSPINEVDGESDCCCLDCTSRKKQPEPEPEPQPKPEPDQDHMMDEYEEELFSKWLAGQCLAPEVEQSKPTTPAGQAGIEPEEPGSPIRRRELASPAQSPAKILDLEALNIVADDDSGEDATDLKNDAKQDSDGDDVVMCDSC